MNQTQGSISIHAQNIMPVIKRWLYSDKDIFIRELVSNGCDAVTKYKMLTPGAEDDFRVTVEVDKEKKELRFIDNGIGMTWEEVEKYINQVAFSGAEEFLKNYQGDEKSGIIGHFGLGFYSAFMVSAKVTIDSLSCQEGAKAVRWESEDGMAFTMAEGSRESRGTTITLSILEDEKEFLEAFRVREVLNRYCGYLAVPVYLFDVNAKPYQPPVKEGEEPLPAEPIKPELINETHPLWLKNPKDCTEEEYKALYHKMFHEFDDPLFWVHLNVDYPFNLKGILYFPKLKQDFGPNDGQVKLFSGQVFVADNIKEIIPEFLLLLKGVIDCPDLPLNVSRSFLQNDGYVKRLSAHITKKVADKLISLFKTQREDYQKYWNDIAPFVKYGCMKDGKFHDSVKDILLLRTTADEYLTFSEYKARNEGKTEKKIYYTNDAKRQAASVQLYTDQGIDVACLDTLIDMNFISFMEYGSGQQEVAFARVDADISGLTQESDEGKDLDASQLQELFRKALGNEALEVKLEALTTSEVPAMVTEDEQTRRFKEMSRLYGQDMQIPDHYSLVLNRRSAAIRSLAAREDDDTTQLLCKQVWDLARMAVQPLASDEIAEFLTRSQKIVELLAGK